MKGMKACVEHVRLLHLSPEGRVRYEVQGSSVTPYSVTLDFRAFKQGSAPEYVVLGCNCMDFVKKGGVCKHAGACCHHLLRHTAEVEQTCVTGPPLAVEAARPPFALEGSRALRRAVSLDVPRTRSQGETLCLAALRQKAKDLQARLFVRSGAATSRPQSSTATVETAALARGVSVQTQTVGKRGCTFLGAVEAQRYTICLLADADQIDTVDLVAYSFDVKDLTDALCHLGAKVRILMDWSMCFGKTRKQLQAAQQLAANGCCVRVGKGFSVQEAYRARDREVVVGSSVRGIVHGKSVLVRYLPSQSQSGTVCVIGSTNWTDSSTANLEFSAVLHAVGEDFEESWSGEFAKGWEQSSSLDSAIQEADRTGYMRRQETSRSASASRGR